MKMNTMLRTTFLFLFLSSAATVSFAQNQFVVQVEDDQGKPVKGAVVSAYCGDGVTRKGVTDAKGEVSVAFSSSENCNLTVTGRGIVPKDLPLSMGQYPTGIVVTMQMAAPGSQLTLEIYDQKNKPVKGANVSINCGDGVARRGVTDARGIFEPPILPSWGRCSMTISGNGIETYSRELYSKTGSLGVEVTRKATATKQTSAQKGTACPPERTLKDGTCGTMAQARAEAQSYCRTTIRGGIAVQDTAGGYSCGCAAGSAVVNEEGDSRCETIRNIQTMAANDCKKRDPGLVASPVDFNGQYECRCPEGKQWREPRLDDRGGCVSTANLDERSNYCDSQISGSVWTKDRMGRLGCFCPPGTEYSGGKCVASGEPGQNCPGGRTRGDGTCVADAEFEAEFNRSCGMSVRGGIAVPDESGGFRCGCRSGTFLINDASGQRCESRQYLATQAANDCRRRNPDLVPTELDIMGRYNCQCPPGKEWREPAVNDPGGCMAKGPPRRTVAEIDKIFLGTWQGTGTAQGITLVIRDDYTGDFTDTRPGYEKSFKNKEWGRDTSRTDFIVTPLGYGLWYQGGKLVDPWRNVYVK